MKIKHGSHLYALHNIDPVLSWSHSQILVSVAARLKAQGTFNQHITEGVEFDAR